MCQFKPFIHSFSASSTPLIIAPDSHEVTSIAEMTSQTSVGVFNVETAMSVSDAANEKNAQQIESHLIVQTVSSFYGQLLR
ncbi:hypothetical protein P3L10_020608 [Capsicum annuum]